MSGIGVLTEKQIRILGSFSTVMRKYMQGFKSGNPDVPCNGCNKCCKSFKEISITDSESKNLNHLAKDGKLFLKLKENGECSYLVDNKCSIYNNRPKTCKEYDCRIYALANIRPENFPHPSEDGVGIFVLRNKTRDDEIMAAATAMAASYAIHELNLCAEEAAMYGITNFHKYIDLYLQYENFLKNNPKIVEEFLEYMTSKVVTNK